MRRFRRRRKRRNFGQRPTSLVGSPSRRFQMGVSHLDRSTAQKIHRGFLLLQNLLIFTKTVTFTFFQLLWDWVEASKQNYVSPRTQVPINWHACKRETLLSLSFLISFCSIREQKKSFLFSLSLFSFVFFSIHASHPSPWGLPTDRQLERSLNCETLFTFFIQNSHFFFILRNSLHFFVLRNSLSLSICEKNVFNK